MTGNGIILRSLSEFEVTISKDGILKNIEKSYVYCPKTKFAGGTVKWFDDTKLVKGGVSNG